MDIFAGKTVIVTGAASGIGRELSEELAGRGADVILADINSEPLEETTSSLLDAGFSARAAVLDVTDFEAVRKLVEDTEAQHGRLDYIFNNAGVTIFGQAQDHTYEDWRKEIDTNLYGVVHGVAAAYPVMVRQGFGHIVNTSSFSGMFPSVLQAGYVTSKAGVLGLTEALRVEGKLHGVKVSTALPGFTRTGMYDSAKLIGLNRDKVIKIVPKGASPQKVAHGILRGVERNKAMIMVPPLQQAIVWLLQRISPGVVRWACGSFTKLMLKIAKSDS